MRKIPHTQKHSINVKLSLYLISASSPTETLDKNLGKSKILILVLIFLFYGLDAGKRPVVSQSGERKLSVPAAETLSFNINFVLKGGIKSTVPGRNKS